MAKIEKSRTPEKQSAAKSPLASAQPATVAAPDRAEIERRAYEIYLARGGVHGYDVDDWVQAERELREAVSKSKGRTG